MTEINIFDDQDNYDEFEDFDEIELGDNDDYDDYGEKASSIVMEEYESLLEESFIRGYCCTVIWNAFVLMTAAAHPF